MWSQLLWIICFLAHKQQRWPLQSPTGRWEAPPRSFPAGDKAGSGSWALTHRAMPSSHSPFYFWETHTCQILLGLILAPQVKGEHAEYPANPAPEASVTALSATGPVSEPFASSSLAPFPGGEGAVGELGTAGSGSTDCQQAPVITMVQQRRCALSPGGSEGALYFSKSPARADSENGTWK